MTANDMTLNMNKGLFQFDLTDYHAILGVALDADAKQIRKRYLAIARKLHPDSLQSASEEEKQQAHDLLSKLVNPAYEKLTQEKSSTEHQVVLRLRGQQLSRQRDTLTVETDAAKAILQNNNPSSVYRSSLQKLTEQQYESLDGVLETIQQISDLNLAYLVTISGTPGGVTPTQAAQSPAPPTAPPAPSGTAATSAPTPPPVRLSRQAIIESYLNRSREFAQRKDYSRAILEMREAVKSHPNDADCHCELASLYCQTGQPTMARIHLKKALDIDPNHERSRQIEPTIHKLAQAKSGQSTSTTAQNKAAQPKGRGGLFGLFGSKEK